MREGERGGPAEQKRRREANRQKRSGDGADEAVSRRSSHTARTAAILSPAQRKRRTHRERAREREKEKERGRERERNRKKKRERETRDREKRAMDAACRGQRTAVDLLLMLLQLLQLPSSEGARRASGGETEK